MKNKPGGVYPNPASIYQLAVVPFASSYRQNTFCPQVKCGLAGEKVALDPPNGLKGRIDPASKIIKMDGAEVNQASEACVWKWMGLATLRCNKRNESSNRLSVNSIRDTLTLHKPFIMMML